MINNAKGLPNWKLWKKTFIKMDPSRKLVSDELIEDITDKINQLDGFSARIMMIAILENLTNEQLNSAAYWAFDIMSDRVDVGDLKITDVTVRDWLCHVSPSIRDLMLDELLKLQAKVDPAKTNTVDSYMNVADQKIHTLNPCSYVGKINAKSEIAECIHQRFIMEKDFYVWKNLRDGINIIYPSSQPIPDEVIDDITDRMDQLSDTGTRLALIAILENLTNAQLANVVYWALTLMGDRISLQTMKYTDVNMDQWMDRISPAVRLLLHHATITAGVLPPREDAHDE